MTVVPAMLRRLFPVRAVLRRRDGAVAMEVAVLTPLLVMLMLQFADFGIAFHHRSKLEAAARAGAQQALAGGLDEARIAAAARATLDRAAGATVRVDVLRRCGDAVLDAAAGAFCADGSVAGIYARVRVSQAPPLRIGILDVWADDTPEGEADVRVS